MRRYGSDPTTLRSLKVLSDTILLRADLHQNFNALKCVIIPKPNSENVLQFVFHLIRSSPELAVRYHNSYGYNIAGIPHQILFTAFTRVTFPLLHEFLAISVSK